ncbi:MAG TPA: methyltransferase domain-containing protein [Mycobacteriales bacterium]|nr:methyltransferase domain-containing protein [Mycobacteriales bacterium]
MTSPWLPVTVTTQRARSTGDLQQVGVQQVIVAEQLCESVAVRAGEHLLDVAAGTGNAAIAAARRYAEVVAVDAAPELLEHARTRAQAEGVRVHTQVADVQDLPFADGRFDVVLSSFGAMFVPDQRRTAAEMARVCRRGGRIGLACWTPDGLFGQQLSIIADFRGGPDGLPSPTRWGTEDGLRELFGDQLIDLTVRRRAVFTAYRSAQHYLQLWGRWFVPMAALLGTLSPEDLVAFRHQITELVWRYNRAGDDTLLVFSAYLEAMLTRR